MPEEWIKKQDVLDYINYSADGYSYIETPTQQMIDKINSLPTISIICCSECDFGEKVSNPNTPNLYYCHQNCMHRVGSFYCANGRERIVSSLNDYRDY